MKSADIKKFFSDKNRRTKIIIAVGILGILLIFISELIPDSSNKINKEKTISSDVVTEDTYEYKCQLENELENMLGKVNGVGEVLVMITIEGTTEYVYAEELNTATDRDGEQLSEKYENEIVMTENNGEKKALVKQIIKPKVSGVVVVCEGGGNITLNERVIKAVSTALNLPTSKICVEASK